MLPNTVQNQISLKPSEFLRSQMEVDHSKERAYRLGLDALESRLLDPVEGCEWQNQLLCTFDGRVEGRNGELLLHFSL